MLSLYFPEPGQRCGTPEVFALLAGAVVVAPAALLLGAIQIPARRELHDRPPWRTASLAALAFLVLLVLANWFSLIKLVWL
jgi:type II secretory pathway component PulL